MRKERNPVSSVFQSQKATGTCQSLLQVFHPKSQELVSHCCRSSTRSPRSHRHLLAIVVGLPPEVPETTGTCQSLLQVFHRKSQKTTGTCQSLQLVFHPTIYLPLPFAKASKLGKLTFFLSVYACMNGPVSRQAVDLCMCACMHLCVHVMLHIYVCLHCDVRVCVCVNLYVVLEMLKYKCMHFFSICWGTGGCPRVYLKMQVAVTRSSSKPKPTYTRSFCKKKGHLLQNNM